VLILVAAAAAAPLALAAAPPAAAEAGHQVASLERDWLAHLSDRAALERSLAGDFVHVAPQGVFLPREQHLACGLAHPPPAERRASFEALRVRVYGNTAIATGIVANTDTAGKDVRRSAFTDVFVLRDGRWQAVNAQENAVTP